MQKFCANKQEHNDPPLQKLYKSRLQDYIRAQQKLIEYQGVGAKDILYQKLKSEIQNAQTLQKYYNTTFFDDIQQSNWPYRLPNKVLEKFKNSNQKLESIFTSLLMIIDGCFQSNSDKGYFTTILMPYLMLYQGYFLFSNKNNYFIIFEIGLHKEFPKQITLVQTHFNYDVLHNITILDIIQCNNNKRMMDFVVDYHLNLESNFYRSYFDNLVCISIDHGQQNLNKKQYFLFNPSDSSWPELMFKNNTQNKTIFLPLKFEISVVDSKNFIFNDQRQQYQDKVFYLIQQKKQQIATISNSNYITLKYYSDLSIAGKIIDYIEQSSEFKIRPSISEKEIIGTKNNSLVIGRSGTGKTTCAILRIFASQYLLKMKVKLNNEKSTNILQDYNSSSIPLRNAFITANSKLVEKVREYYVKLRSIVKEIARKHKNDKTNNLDVSTLSDMNPDKFYREYNAFENILNDEQQIDEEKGENVNLRRKKLHQLQFPCFISTLDLLILLDKQLKQPYFSEDRIYSLRERFGYQAGYKLQSGINLNEYFPIPNYEKAKIIVPEIDFEVFYEKFWPKVQHKVVQNHDPTALPSLIWTQIYSVIKGSQYSYKYPGNYLPFQIYKQIIEKHLDDDQLNQVYAIFILYEEWKNLSFYFDQLDIVNNILRNYQQLSLELFPIHNIFVDEIQDLPMAVLELMSQIAEQNFMFSGDAAQSILKGIGFRFQDLQSSLENTKSLGINKANNFSVYKLVTNYRSHNNILQLANSIVTMLELLFPLSLDKLQKEISNLKGPKPIIFQENERLLLLSTLKEQYIGDECQDIEFGFNQVIIIRNLEDKENIPKIFDNMQILTVFQAKGLEFDDVILYNFFESDVISEQQWDLLLCFDVEEQMIDQSVYQHNITKHQQEETDIVSNFDQYQMVKKLKMNYGRFQNKKVNINEYTGLCDELKALYVCITRAKKRLFIYDEDQRKRKFIEKLLINLDVCKLVQNYENELKFYQSLKSKQQEQRELTESEKNDWNEKGQYYFDNKIFDEAIKCFRKAKNLIMLEESEILNFIKKGEQKKRLYKQCEKQRLFQQAEQNLNQFRDYFYQAAKRFEQKNEIINAAKCYYSGRHYLECIEIYLSEDMFVEAQKAAIKSKNSLLASLISLKQNSIRQCIQILSDSKGNELFQQYIVNLAYNTQQITPDEVIMMQDNENYQKRIIANLEHCSKQELASVDLTAQKQKQKSKKNKKQKQQQGHSVAQGFNLQIWEKFYTEKVFSNAPNSQRIAELLKEELKLFQESQLQLKYSPIIAMSINFKYFDQIYFKIFESNSLIGQRYDLAQIQEEQKEKYSKQEESSILRDFFQSFLEQGNHVNFIYKIQQKMKISHIFIQNQYLRKQLLNLQLINLPKLDQSTFQEILNQETFIFSIISKNFTQFFQYLLENYKKKYVEQTFNEILDYFQTTRDFHYDKQISIIRYNTGIFDQLDKFQYAPSVYDQNIMSEDIWLNDKIKDALEYHENDQKFYEQCLEIQSKKGVQDFAKKIDKKDNYELKEVIWKIINYNMKEINQSHLAETSSLQKIFKKLFLQSTSNFTKEEIDPLFSLSSFDPLHSQIFLFQTLLKINQDYQLLKKFFQSCELRQVFLTLKFLYEGSNLCQFDAIDNQHLLVASSIFKFYIFKSNLCGYFSPQFAIIHKDSQLLEYEEYSQKFNFDEQHYLTDTQNILNLASNQYQQVLNSINFIDALSNIIYRDNLFLNYHQNKYMCEEHINFIIENFLIQMDESNPFGEYILKEFLKVCSILNQLKLNAKKILNLDEMSFWNNYIKFQQYNQKALSFNGLQKWAQFYKQIRFNIFDIYHPSLLIHELKQISLTYLISLLPNTLQSNNSQYLNFYFETFQNDEFSNLMAQFQIYHCKPQIREYDEEVLYEQRDLLKVTLEYFLDECKNYQKTTKIFQTNPKSFNLLLSGELQTYMKKYFFTLNDGIITIEPQTDTKLIETTKFIIALFVQILQEADFLKIDEKYKDQISQLFVSVAVNQKRFFTHVNSQNTLRKIVQDEIKFKLEDSFIIDASKLFIQKLLNFYESDWINTRARNQDLYKFEIYDKMQCSFNRTVQMYHKTGFHYSLRQKVFQINTITKQQPENILKLYEQFYELKRLINELTFNQLLSIYQQNQMIEIMQKICDQEIQLDQIVQKDTKQSEIYQKFQFLNEQKQIIKDWANRQKLKDPQIYSICMRYLD